MLLPVILRRRIRGWAGPPPCLEPHHQPIAEDPALPGLAAAPGTQHKNCEIDSSEERKSLEVFFLLLRVGATGILERRDDS